jgi:hypothetical protein
MYVLSRKKYVRWSRFEMIAFALEHFQQVRARAALHGRDDAPAAIDASRLMRHDGRHAGEFVAGVAVHARVIASVS